MYLIKMGPLKRQTDNTDIEDGFACGSLKERRRSMPTPPRENHRRGRGANQASAASNTLEGI